MADAKVAKAGEVRSIVNEGKVLKLIHQMVPESRERGVNLQEAIMYLLAEVDRLRRQLKEAPEKGTGDMGAVLAGIKRLETSLQNVKEQFSTMRQYGIGMK